MALPLVSWQNHRQVLVSAPLAANLFDWRVVWRSSQARPCSPASAYLREVAEIALVRAGAALQSGCAHLRRSGASVYVHLRGDQEDPDAAVRAFFKLVAGARFVADSERLPVVTAHWLYAGIKHAEREMARVGVAS